MRSSFGLSLLATAGGLATFIPEIVDAAEKIPVPKIQSPPTKPTSKVSFNPFINLVSSDTSGTQPVANFSTPCSPQPIGAGPVPSPDTPAAFRNYSVLINTATTAMAPAGYVSLNPGGLMPGAVKSVGYLGGAYLDAYDPNQCAQLCNLKTGCVAMNLFFERGPTLNPSSLYGCPNPPSTTNIKCVLWGNELGNYTAVNTGEFREQFELVVVGSNVWNKVLPGGDLTAFGFNYTQNASINALFNPPPEPVYNYNTTLGYQIFPYKLAFYYTPETCARGCNSITAQNMMNASTPAPQYQNGAYDVCNFFTVFEVHKNGVPTAMGCAYYSAAWDPMYANWTGTTDTAGDYVQPRLVSIYTKSSFPDPPICANATTCGTAYYGGGDCSGWGPSYCVNQTASTGGGGTP